MAASPSPKKPGRARRVIVNLAAWFSFALVFVIALTAGGILHSDLPASRRILAKLVTHLGSADLEGRIVIEELGELSFRGIDSAKAKVYDPEGREVLALDGVTLRVFWPELAYAALLERGEPTFTLRRLRIENAEIRLFPDEAERISLLRALSPKAGPPSEGPERESRPIKLWLPAVRIAHASIRGELAPIEGAALPIDIAFARLGGSVLVSEGQTSISVGRFGLALRKLDARKLLGDAAKESAEARGIAEFRLDLPSSSGAPLYSLFRFDGFIDDIQASLKASVDGRDIAASLDIPRAKSESLRAVFPDVPIYDTAALSAKIEGSWPKLDARARLQLGDGEIEAHGPLFFIEDDPEAHFELSLRGLNLQSVEPSAPRTSVDGKGNFQLRFADQSGLKGAFDFETRPTTIEGFDLPRLSMRGSFDEKGLQTNAMAHFPGMPTTVRKLALRPGRDGQGVVVEAEIEGDLPAIEKMPMLGNIAKGRAHWYARGTLASGRIDSNIGILLNDVERSDIKLEQAAIVGKIQGTLDRPSIDASLIGHHIAMGGVGFRNLRATALGPLKSPQLVASLEHDDLPLVTAKARLQIAGSEVALDNLEIEAKRRENRVALRAEKASFGRGGVKVPVFEFEGAGNLSGSLHIGPEDMAISARSEGLDIGLLAALVDGRERAQEAALKTRNAFLADAFPVLWSNYVDGMQAKIDVALEKGRLGERGYLVFSFERAAQTALPELRLHIDLSVVDNEVSGNGISFALGELASVTALSEGASLQGSFFELDSWEALKGKVSMRSSLDFEQIDKLSQMLLAEPSRPFKKLGGVLSTRLSIERGEGDSLPNIELSSSTKGLQLIGAPSTDSEGPEPAWASEDLDFSLGAYIGWREQRARLRASVAHGGREFAELIAEAEPPFADILANPSRAWKKLKSAPLAMHFRMPKAKIASLPSLLRPGWFNGDIEMTADLHGSLEMPIVTFEAGGYGLVSADRGDVPLVLGAYAAYGFSEAELQLRVTEPSGGDVTVSANIEAALEDWIAPPKTNVDGPAPSYGERLRHFLLEKTRAEARLRANAFRLAPFQPLVSQVFTQLDGLLDGSFRVHQEPGKEGAKRRLEGLAEVREGLVQLPEIGQELHHATAHIEADGGSTIHVKDISAQGVTGRLTADLEIVHDNLAFQSLTSTIEIAERERLPLTLEGVSFGDAWGKVHVHMREGKDDGGLKATIVDVEIPRLHIDLPESSTRNVQGLGDNPRVAIGTRGHDGEFLPILLGPKKEARDDSRWLVHFRLGELTLRRGTLLQLGVTGAPRMAVTDRAYASGDLWLTGGTVEVFGKRFEIVHGNIRFHPATEPSNPWVAISASWDAPDATRVYADYVGPVKTGTLTLRSEPARTPSEILSLVLMGSIATDLEAGSQQSETGSAAAGVGTSLATLGLNRVLSGVTGTSITTRVDTTVAQNPRPEVAIRLSDSVTAEVAYSTGLPAPGQNPDRVLVTLGWHFRQRWSLSTTVGDKGSSIVDVIWQYRY